MATLRSDQGCPWDRRQSLETLSRFLLEEAYEVLDAIESGDRSRLREELGDLLLQIVFQSQLCAEEGSFSFDDVAAGITEKLVRRHPHVYGDVKADTPDDVLRNWDAIKKQENGGGDAPPSVLDGVPPPLPALQRAYEIQVRASRQGFDWPDPHGALEKIAEELEELKNALADGRREEIRGEVGDMLFSMVNLARFLAVEPEAALRSTIARFLARFRAVERDLHSQGRAMKDCPLEELDAMWEEAKARE
jgi:MazG family protein